MPGEGPEPLEEVSEISHLVLAGGGARAVAHFGALAALAELGYLVRVESTPTSQFQPPVDYYLDSGQTKGVAGSSTGGLIAALLSMGVGIRTAYNMVVPGGEPDAPDFLDTLLEPEEWKKRFRPTFSGFEITEIENPNEELWGVGRGHVHPLGWVADAAGMEESELTKFLNAAGTAAGTYLAAFDATIGHDIPPELTETVLQSGELATYVRNLVVDHGLFSGRRLRDIFGSRRSILYQAGLSGGRSPILSRHVERQATTVEGPGGEEVTSTPIADLGNLTFGQYADHVDRTRGGISSNMAELALTGTDLTDQRGQVFSRAETPDVPIADAIRMTMAFPILFTPTVVDDGALAGTWVDGSLTNAYPLHAFDDDGAMPDGVLGFRLGIPRSEEVGSFVDLVRAVTGRFLDVSTTGQIRSDREAARTIALPVGDLPYLKVPSGADRLRPVLEGAATAVYEYFDERRPRARASAAVGEVLLAAPGTTVGPGSGGGPDGG